MIGRASAQCRQRTGCDHDRSNDGNDSRCWSRQCWMRRRQRVEQREKSGGCARSTSKMRSARSGGTEATVCAGTRGLAESEVRRSRRRTRGDVARGRTAMKRASLRRSACANSWAASDGWRWAKRDGEWCCDDATCCVGDESLWSQDRGRITSCVPAEGRRWRCATDVRRRSPKSWAPLRRG